MGFVEMRMHVGIEFLCTHTKTDRQHEQNKAYFAQAFEGIWSSLMPQVWFPAPEQHYRWLSVLIAVVLVVAAYLGVYMITQSVPFARLASVLIFGLFVAVLRISLRRKPI